VLDQRLLPGKMKHVTCTTARCVWKAIKELKVRGAPAIGIAAAYGAYLGIKNSRTKNYDTFKKEFNNVAKYIDSSRPTARNLGWALERLSNVVVKDKQRSVDEIKKNILKEAHKILSEDVSSCRSIGKFSRKLIKKGDNVLTHCNAGALATGGYGTALGIIRASKSKIKNVYVDETRPVLQGARLTAWELMKEDIPYTLICDNMAASLMKDKKIDLIVVGADRIASNGDAANKIGTYNLAVLAKYHNIPFYIAAPLSTFDMSIKDGRGIPIEERSSDEIKTINGKYTAPKTSNVFNPAFDVTPAKLITAIITEKGIILHPNRLKIIQVCGL